MLEFCENCNVVIFTMISMISYFDETESKFNFFYYSKWISDYENFEPDYENTLYDVVREILF